MSALASRVSPIAAWLVLGGAAASLFPLQLEGLYAILLGTMLLSVIWLPGRRLRSAPFLALYTITAIMALNVHVPLPSTWHPLVRLLLTVAAWAIPLIVSLAFIIAYLLRTARPNHARHRSR